MRFGRREPAAAFPDHLGGADFAPLSLARAQTKSRVVGATAEEQDSFVDRVLAASADVVLLDQNIDLGNQPRLKGHDLARQLQHRGFRGVACILTGASERHAQALRSAPGVDLVCLKGIAPRKLAKQLRAAMATKKQPCQGNDGKEATLP